MGYETILYEAGDGIAVVTLNRPDKLNALNRRVIDELDRVLDAVASDPGVGVMILTGSGEKAFAAGADIGELAELDPVSALELARRGQALTLRMERLGKPIVAAINGFALGGGCELAMACTIRIAAENAKFGQPEVNLGVLPGYGGTQRLPRLVGKGRALEITLTGRMIDAREAAAIGLVSQVVPAGELLEAARKMAGTLREKGPIALRYTMEAIHAGLEQGMDGALATEARLFGVCAGTEDMKEGLGAFLEKRKAKFKGR